MCVRFFFSGTKKKGWKKGSRERQYDSQFLNDDIPILDAARAVIVGLAEDAWLGGTTYVGSCPSREGHRGGVVLFFDFERKEKGIGAKTDAPTSRNKKRYCITLSMVW